MIGGQLSTVVVCARSRVLGGIGVIHSALLLSDTERTIVTGRSALPQVGAARRVALVPTPAWFVDNTGATETSRRLTRLAARPRWRALPGIVVSALKG